MKQRWLAYLTLLFTLLLPLLGVVWVRSHLDNDTIFRVGAGRAMALDCINGEASLWIAPSRDTGPVRYERQTVDSTYGVTAAQLFAQQPGIREFWFLGFGYAETRWMPSDVRGTTGITRCFVVPLWFLAIVIGLLPGLKLVQFIRREREETSKATVQCRRCGAELAMSDERCPQCSFPAFTPGGVTA
ncbi:MAG: hypothetical protein WBD40_19420 [Tepidisphaeraceae bacterium]